MLYALVTVACLACMVHLFRRCCLNDGRVHINPVFGLLVGLSFYVLLPCTVVYYFSDVIDALTAYGRELNPSNARLLMVFTLGLLLALNLGVWLFQSSRIGRLQAKRDWPSVTLHRRWTSGASWPATLAMCSSLLLFTALAISVRSSLFSGYEADVLADDSVWAARGAMSSSYSIFYVSMCAFILRRRHQLKRRESLLLAVAFAGCSVILLSMGARLYVAMALVSLLALKSVLSNGLPTRQLSTFLIGGAVMMGAVGVLRSGSLESIGSVFQNVMLEPLLTSISVFTLLTDNAPIWLGKPFMLLADFQAVMPSILFPGKSGLFQRLEEYGYAFEAPVGGYHVYFSGLINFGLAGMLLLAPFAGYFLARISRRPLAARISTSTLLCAIYLSGAMAFTVFRDPFFISIAKNVLIMAVVLPLLLTAWSSGRAAKRSGLIAEASR